MIRLDKVTKLYKGGREALREVSLDIGPGEMIFLTGHSGAGKSTILKLLALVERPTQGQLLVDGRNVGRMPAREIPAYRQQVGMVFQDHKLLDGRSAFDNVALPLVIAGLARRDIEKRVRAALDQVGLLDKERHAPRTLSAGEQQRVGIARAVVARPRLLIADEPTGNLDGELSLEIMQLFRRFNEVGVTMVIATHDLALAGRIGGRHVVLSQGRVLSGDAPLATAPPAQSAAR
ncbi:Cell division ATP-binding protein FtsE [Gammaproteobacteria bacterium]|nr:cell division ATP-binding protein FtsE [Gammaproteobacteria bacterium]CAG0943793.1 Cell division ATP-binding protein FtsE [Gammaproteobacteria bacterium]